VPDSFCRSTPSKFAQLTQDRRSTPSTDHRPIAQIAQTRATCMHVNSYAL